MNVPIDELARLRAWIAADGARMRVLRTVHALGLPDCWVAAGFVRKLVWDHLHRYPGSSLPADIDVIWFDPARATAQQDAALESALRDQDGTLAWSVKNQARMHGRNGDAPYLSAVDAMRYWPETATAVGVRLDDKGAIEVAAPFGLADLFGLRVRPTARFATEKRDIHQERLRAKDWPATWPGLILGEDRVGDDRVGDDRVRDD